MTTKVRRIQWTTAIGLSAILFAIWSEATEIKYQKPPKAVLDVFSAPPFPVALPNPTGDTLLLVRPVFYPPVDDLAKPMLRLAGLRIDPTTNGEHHSLYWSDLSLRRIADNSEVKIELPLGSRPNYFQWSADGKWLAFPNTRADGIELWVADTNNGQPRRLDGVLVNGIFMPFTGVWGPTNSPTQWMPDQKSLLVKMLPPSRGPSPAALETPQGPNVQESSGGHGPSSTYEMRDVLKSPHDEDLFDYYACSQLALVDVTTGASTPVGKPGVYANFSSSPDGQYLLVERIRRPYSYLHTYQRFPKDVEIWTRSGEIVHKLASLPLADQVPIRGVPTGPRNYSWLPTEPATLIWVEALDGGNPRRRVLYRDQVRLWKAPFTSKPADAFKTEQRYMSAYVIEKSNLMLVQDLDVERHWRRTFLVDVQSTEPVLQLLWELSSDDFYKYPGYPVHRVLPNGKSAVRLDGDWIYLVAYGGSPEGDRPFLDRFNLRTRKTERLFRSDKSSFESFVAWVEPSRGEFITRRESPVQPPNYYLRVLTKDVPKRLEPGEASFISNLRAITTYPDPSPQLRQIKKQLVKYKRPDGVDLSFTLYLPPNYKPGTRLPTVFYAYPLDYTDPEVAGQVQGSTQAFTMFNGASPLYFVLAGYAVLDNVAMPIVGPSLTAYDTYLEQLVADAKAAIDKAVEMGVTDPQRIGVIGHSHGALMTANLLAHSDLFRAGIARSGSHNKSLTAFGFQNERRTLWEARDTYIQISPLFFANMIKQPLLLIHGEADANPGTIPLQSERLYEAIRGTGGIVRLVMLPFESHVYEARESNEHVLYEMLSWFDRYVKSVSPREPKLTTVGPAPH